MRILVVTSCGKKKRFQSTRAPFCSDIVSKDAREIWIKRLPDLVSKAGEMYIGYQSTELIKGIEILRSLDNIEVTLFVVSAGFGLIAETDDVPPYECTFSRMGKEATLARARMLEIPSDFTKLLETGYDLIYLALGMKYMVALGSEWINRNKETTVLFGSLAEDERVVSLPANASAVKDFSAAGYKIHGVAGFKGDLLRILAQHVEAQSEPTAEIKKWKDPAHIRKLYCALRRADDNGPAIRASKS